MDHAIQTQELVHCFGERLILDRINLQIEKGEIFGLLGPSGAGKTTLIKILTGQLKPTEGEASVMGKNVGRLNGNDYSRIGIMMDNFGLYDRLSCYDNLKLFAKIHNQSMEKIDKVLQKVGLASANKTAAMNLSKGMRNRLLFARALLSEPDILFLDEPTSGLDPAATEEIHKLIENERARGATIFLTTHNMVEASKLCDHIALLNEGNIVEYGEPTEICRRYNHQKKILVHLKDGTDVEMQNDRTAAVQISGYLEKEIVETIHSTEPDLETVFMELTGRKFD